MRKESGFVLTADQESIAPPTNGDSGPTEDREDTPWVGLKILRAGKSLMGKSFAIEVKHIFLVVTALALMAGFLAGIKVEQSRFDTFMMGGYEYRMVGVSQVPGYPNIFIPCYQRTIREGK